MKQLPIPLAQPSTQWYKDLHNHDRQVQIDTYPNGLIRISIIDPCQNSKPSHVATAMIGTTDAQDLSVQLVVSRPPPAKVYY